MAKHVVTLTDVQEKKLEVIEQSTGIKNVSEVLRRAFDEYCEKRGI